MSNTKADQKEGSPKEQKSRESSKTADDKPSKAEKAAERKKNSNSPPEESQEPKKVVKQGVTGTVKWFNVVNRYGFISRNDVSEDIFVHQTAIASFNPKKAVASLGDGEEVVFDVVEGENGPEASNVTGPNGDAVQGSKHAPDKLNRSYGGGRGFYRRGYRRGGRGGTRNSGSEQDAEHSDSAPRDEEGGRPPRRGRGGGFRRGGFRGSGGPGFGSRPRPPPKDGNDGEEFQGGNGEGPPRRGGRGRGRGRGGRGGPRRAPQQFSQEG